MTSESLEMTQMSEAASPSTESSSKARKSAIEDIEGRRNYLVGIGLLLLVVLLWTSSSFLTQVRIICVIRASRVELTEVYVGRIYSKEDMKNRSCKRRSSLQTVRSLNGVLDIE